MALESILLVMEVSMKAIGKMAICTVKEHREKMVAIDKAFGKMVSLLNG